MALALNGTPTQSTGDTAATSTTFAHSVAAGLSNSLLIVHYTSGGGGASTSATYNGVAMTLGTNFTIGQFYCDVWYLVNPNSGANNVVINFPSNSSWNVVAQTFTGAAQTGQFNITGNSNGSGLTTKSTSVTTTVDNCWAVHFTTTNGASAFVEGTGQTNIASVVAANSYEINIGYKAVATAGAVTMTLSWTTAVAVEQGVVAIVPAIDPPTVGNFFQLF